MRVLRTLGQGTLVNELTRPEPMEVLYDTKHKKRLLHKIYQSHNTLLLLSVSVYLDSSVPSYGVHNVRDPAGIKIGPHLLNAGSCSKKV